MPRVRLIIRGVTTLGEARAAVASGADAIGLDPSDLPSKGLAVQESLAEIALSLPPTVTPVLISHALTAGTIAQQVDACAVTAVQIARPLPVSEYPGLKRIIRGRKIIQSIRADDPGALDLIASSSAHADALHLDAVSGDGFQWCHETAVACALPIFVRLDEISRARALLELFRPFAVEVMLPREWPQPEHRLAELVGLLQAETG